VAQDKWAPADVGATTPDPGGGWRTDSNAEAAWPVQPSQWVTDPARTPRSVHLTWQHNPATTITVQWHIDRDALDGYQPRVWFAPAGEARGTEDSPAIPLAPDMVATGACHEYPEKLLGVAVGDTFAICIAEVTGLTGDTRYYYRAGSWEDFDFATGEFSQTNLSPLYSFRTGLEKGSTQAFTFISAGDSRNGYENIAANTPRLAQLDAGFWLFNGDMNANGTQAEWDQWFEAMSPVTTSTVLLPVQGNHEIFENVFYEQFALPSEEGLPEEFRERAWSVDYGNLHITGLNTNTKSVILEQLEWVESDLAAAAADPDTDWLIVMTHHPAYSSSTAHGSTIRVQQYLVPLFEKYGVDLAFAGHDHAYERTWPVLNNQVADGWGVTYVVAGGFFAPGYANGNDWFTAVSHHGDKYNYVVVEVDGDTLRCTAYSGDGEEVLDTFELKK